MGVSGDAALPCVPWHRRHSPCSLDFTSFPPSALTTDRQTDTVKGLLPLVLQETGWGWSDMLSALVLEYFTWVFLILYHLNVMWIVFPGLFVSRRVSKKLA